MLSRICKIIHKEVFSKYVYVGSQDDQKCPSKITLRFWLPIARPLPIAHPPLAQCSAIAHCPQWPTPESWPTWGPLLAHPWPTHGTHETHSRPTWGLLTAHLRPTHGQPDANSYLWARLLLVFGQPLPIYCSSPAYTWPNALLVAHSWPTWGLLMAHLRPTHGRPDANSYLWPRLLLDVMMCLDKLRTLGNQKIVGLLCSAWTKVGQTEDFGESKDCPTFVLLQWYTDSQDGIRLDKSWTNQGLRGVQRLSNFCPVAVQPGVRHEKWRVLTLITFCPLIFLWFGVSSED